MRGVNLDRVQALLAMASRYSLPDDLAASELAKKRRTKKFRASTDAKYRAWWKKELKARKWKLTRALVKARGERRRERWPLGAWGTGDRRFRSWGTVLRAHGALKAAFGDKGTLDNNDVVAACGKRWWRSDTTWMLAQGLCVAEKVPYAGRRVRTFMRVFKRTDKPWIDWQPRPLHRKAYEALERAENEYLE